MGKNKKKLPTKTHSAEITINTMFIPSRKENSSPKSFIFFAEIVDSIHDLNNDDTKNFLSFFLTRGDAGIYNLRNSGNLLVTFSNIHIIFG